MPGGKPIVLIVHAQTDPPLPELGEEAANVREAVLRSGNCEPHILLAASTDRIFNELNERGDRIAIVHYAGHANGEGVVLQQFYDCLAAGHAIEHAFKQAEAFRWVFQSSSITGADVNDSQALLGIVLAVEPVAVAMRLEFCLVENPTDMTL